MKKLSLKPYPGVLLFTRDRAEFNRLYRRLAGVDAPDDIGLWGRTAEFATNTDKRYLVFASRYSKSKAFETSVLVHELSHVVLDVFEHIGTDPRSGRGEPFCYLLDHLVQEVSK